VPDRPGVRARVTLVAPDGWTQLAVSRPIRLPRGARARGHHG
jgi:hypothetical protein